MYSSLLKVITLIILSIFFLNSCGKSVDAKKFPPNPKERVKKNLEEGKGFRLDTGIDKIKSGGRGGNFEFASSNELWRATLDVLDFMPLSSVNYSGGVIISDWYNNGNDSLKTIKVSVRFLSNEVRSDALNIKVFYKICDDEFRCKVSERNSEIKKELKKEILKKAAVYKKQNRDKNFKPYNVTPKKSRGD